MGYKSILLDTNICIDAVHVRKPYASNALEIIERSQFEHLNTFIAAHSFDTIFYVLRKTQSIEKRYNLIEELRAVFQIASVT